MTISSVSKRVSYDCSMTCHFLVYQLNIHIFKVTCSFFISFSLYSYWLARAGCMYSLDRLALKKIPHANRPPQLPMLIKYGQLICQLTTRSEIIFFFVEHKIVPQANSFNYYQNAFLLEDT